MHTVENHLSSIMSHNSRLNPFRILTLTVLLIVAIVVVCMIMQSVKDGNKRIQCAGQLKGFNMACMMYASDYHGYYPGKLTDLANDPSGEYVGWYTPWWQCPSTGTTKPASIDDLSLHCDYLYFGTGLQVIKHKKKYYYSTPIDDDDLCRLVVVCDKPGNHDGYICFAVATGSSFSHKKGNSIEELADKYGLLVPGYNLFPDQGSPGGNPVSAGIDEVEKPENR